MRPLILKMEMTVDGFVGKPDEEPGWPTHYYDDEFSAYMLELISSAGVHALGRVSYVGMAPYWQSSDDAFAKPMNEIPKAVFSRTLTEAEADWPETTLYRDIASGIAELKAQEGGPILTYGGAGFAQELTRLGSRRRVPDQRAPDRLRHRLPALRWRDGPRPPGRTPVRRRLRGLHLHAALTSRSGPRWSGSGR